MWLVHYGKQKKIITSDCARRHCKIAASNVGLSNLLLIEFEKSDTSAMVVVLFLLLLPLCVMSDVCSTCLRLQCPCWSRTTKKERWLCPLLWLWLSKSLTKQWTSASCPQRKVYSSHFAEVFGFGFDVKKTKTILVILTMVVSNSFLKCKLY